MTRNRDATNDVQAWRANMSPDTLALNADKLQEAAYLQPNRTEIYAELRNAGALGGAMPELAAQSMVLPLPPSTNGNWHNYNGRTVLSDEVSNYRAGVRLLASAAGIRPFSGNVAVYVHVYRSRTDQDLDNYSGKTLLDALNGVMFRDDIQVVELHSFRHDDKANPRVEVEVRRAIP